MYFSLTPNTEQAEKITGITLNVTLRVNTFKFTGNTGYHDLDRIPNETKSQIINSIGEKG